MFLYELAIELGVRSSDVVDAASLLGFAEVGPASSLTPEQTAALRRHFAELGPAQRPALGSSAPLPAVPSGPLLAEPPPSGGVERAATAPASWGPPVPPPSFTPPPPEPPTAPVASSGAPVFTPPPPEPPSGTGTVGIEGATLPPTPPTTWPSGGGAPPSAGPVAGDGTGAEGGWSNGQKVVLAAVALLVMGLFGYMVINTGPDRERERAILAADEAIERDRAAAATSTTEATTTTEAATTTVAPNAYAPTDVEAFCRGGLAVATFELRLVAAIVDADFAEVRAIVVDRRAAWHDDLRVMASGAPPIQIDDIERYEAGYVAFFDAIEASRTLEEAYSIVDELTLARASNAGQEWGRLVTFHCE
jgi:hypothetical protein